MSRGKIIADGPPRQVFQDVEGLRAVGLTVPETVQLLYELRQEGLDLPLDAISDEECAQALRRYLEEKA
ncbi:Energy-coupling factor transporter ATP-binding protein EcfA2 [bioreactor metagenome]|uniref:Energy-coupling factor transporter ATP-binding protein EcfA2 n=1 Tax=bioreactor metagenome TaxID=1076179 RepID=A0A645AGJ5_9ZZZZ